MDIHDRPIAMAQMLVRRPVNEVFNAFVDPTITTRFWFSGSSGALAVGKQIRWDWEMYGSSTNVEVRAIEPNRRILIEWDGAGSRNTVEWIFTPRSERETFVTISERGFSGDGDKVVKQALASTGGFNLVLAGLKVFLEHGIDPGLVIDHDPDAVVEGARR